MFHCTQGHCHHPVSTRNASQPSIQGSNLAVISSEGAGKLNYFREFHDEEPLVVAISFVW